MATIPNKVQLRLTSSLKKFQNVLKNAKVKDINESDTVAIVMDMLAEIFGYDKYSEITSELAVKRTFCDLAVKIDSKLRFLIEIKAIGLELKSDHIRQAVDYGSNQGVDWVILTNGVHWMIFKIIFGKPISNELVYEFDIILLNPKKESDFELLYYVCKESLSKSALEDYRLQKQALSKYYIGQVLITDPVLESIKKTIKKINPDVKITTEEIKDVLMLDVIKREVFDDEKSDDAKKKINKVFKTVIKKEPPLIVKPSEVKNQITNSTGPKLSASSGS
jgi:predicted type IV restriction endonuclease